MDPPGRGAHDELKDDPRGNQDETHEKIDHFPPPLLLVREGYR
jgi:hypothetical protein